MNNFIAIDFETAVNNPNSAISIGLVKYRDCRPVDKYYSLIRPPTLYIRPDFTDIHGLTVDDVKDMPNFRYLWGNGIRDFLGETVLAAHNAAFDMGVLKAVLQWYNLHIPELRYFCTCDLARRTWPGLRSYALSILAAKFSITYKAHNALDDAMTCGRLVRMSSEKFSTGPDIEDLLHAAETDLKFLAIGD
jgi:DNA polymerase-3 subunit epsilon